VIVFFGREPSFIHGIVVKEQYRVLDNNRIFYWPKVSILRASRFTLPYIYEVQNKQYTAQNYNEKTLVFLRKMLYKLEFPNENSKF